MRKIQFKLSQLILIHVQSFRKNKKAMGEATIPKPVKFLFGGSAGMAATCFVQPLDLVKTRMQVSKDVGGAKPSTFSVISSVIKNEGIATLYTGLSAGLLRQATYTTTRLGIYTWLFETFSTDGKPPGFFMKAALGRCNFWHKCRSCCWSPSVEM